MAKKNQNTQPDPRPQPPVPVEMHTKQTRSPGAGSDTGSTGAAASELSRQRPLPDLSAGKPIPTPTLETAPYWESCRRHQLRIQQCSNCMSYQFFPRIYCSKCFSEEIEWVDASGRAKVLSFTVVRHPVSPAYAAKIPYVVGLVTLEEGPQMMTNIVECAPEEVWIGMPVEVVFEDWNDQISIPQFRPRRS